MNITKSISSRIGLIMCIPLILEITIFSSSIILLNQIDEARVARQKIGSVSYSYVDTLVSAISDYIAFTTTVGHNQKADRDKVNAQFVRTAQALAKFATNCRIAGLKYTDIQGPVQRDRNKYFSYRRPPKIISSDQVTDRMSGRHVLLDAIAATHNRLGKRIEILRSREDTESRLIAKLNTMLIVALVLSLALTLGLSVLFSKVIIERVAILRSNIFRLTKDVGFLPPISGDDEIAKLDATFRSMSEALANAKRRDELILKNSIDVICALDRELKILRISDSCESMWDVSSQSIVGKVITEFISDETTDSTMENFRLAIIDSVSRTFENESLSANNQVIPCLWSVQWSAEDELYICVVHDISERKMAEERRQTLLAIISHDLRSPLTATKLCIDMLKTETQSDVEVYGKLEVADDSVDYVISVTNDLIDLFRFQQSKLSLKLKLSTLQLFIESLEKDFHNNRFDALIVSNDGASSYLTVDDEYLLRVFSALSKQCTRHYDQRAVKIMVSENASNSVVFAFAPWMEKVTLKTDSAYDVYQKSSSEITMAFCREIISNLHGSIFETGEHMFELHLPSVAVT